MTMFDYLNLFGTAIFAISGAFTAARKGMDYMGVLFLAFIVGNGGGTMRDALLGHGAVYWIHDPAYIWVSIVPGLLAVLIARFIIPPYRLLLIFDALGLGVFVVTGAQIAFTDGVSPVVAVIMGILTATGGGLIRDLVCNEIPLVLKHEIYATAAFAGVLFYVCLRNHLPDHTVVAISIAITFIIRSAAIYFNWSFPAFSQAWFREARKKERQRRFDF